VAKYPVCAVDELPPGHRTITEVRGLSVGVFNVDGRFYALLNRCPHQSAPLCRGIQTDYMHASEPYRYERERPGEIIQCPWHGWEFDLTTGRSVFNPHRVRVKSYQVSVEGVGGSSPMEKAPEDPAVDTFPVTVEKQVVMIHIGG
jgi:nitrite reductase/ring-hydroxylating ferredoxin subunit